MEISDRLLKLATFYNKEAQRCLKGRAHLAAIIMQVSALEAALQSMCFIYFRDVKKTSVYQRKKFKGKRYRALELNLYQLIAIAEELSWFPPKKTTWGGTRAALAGFAQEARKLRNFVHPGVWVREQTPTKFSKQMYSAIEEIFDVSTSWLGHRIEQDLRKGMKREGVL